MIYLALDVCLRVCTPAIKGISYFIGFYFVSNAVLGVDPVW